MPTLAPGSILTQCTSLALVKRAQAETIATPDSSQQTWELWAKLTGSEFEYLHPVKDEHVAVDAEALYTNKLVAFHVHVSPIYRKVKKK
jgi:hypothetical protein